MLTLIPIQIVFGKESLGEAAHEKRTKTAVPSCHGSI